jgi:hypothetical protein
MGRYITTHEPTCQEDDKTVKNITNLRKSWLKPTGMEPGRLCCSAMDSCMKVHAVGGIGDMVVEREE